jgi:hypothetical protein
MLEVFLRQAGLSRDERAGMAKHRFGRSAAFSTNLWAQDRMDESG